MQGFVLYKHRIRFSIVLRQMFCRQSKQCKNTCKRAYSEQSTNFKRFFLRIHYPTRRLRKPLLSCMGALVASSSKTKFLQSHAKQSQPAKSLKSNPGGVSFCWIGIQNAMPYCSKYTPPHCFFCNFAGWVHLHLQGTKPCVLFSCIFSSFSILNTFLHCLHS